MEIYLDHAATTPVDKCAMAEALPYYSEIFYNPASAHVLGQRAASAVEKARERVKNAVNAPNARDIYFTSGGTEAVNWVLRSAELGDKKRILISAIEHDSVRSCAERLKECGYIIDTVMPDSDGIITEAALCEALRDGTGLVCVMTVNNQVGSVQPIKQLAAAAHRAGALFFTDGVQAMNALDVDVSDSNVDFFCASGHKFYAPKGSGFLYVKAGTKISPLLDGGEQERGLRAGTSDVPAIVGMGKAAELACERREQYKKRIRLAREVFLNELKTGVPIVPRVRIDDIVSVVFDGINGGRLAVALSMAGVCCSVGSACSAGSAVTPHTLVAMGVKAADSAVRFSFGFDTDERSAALAAKTVDSTVERLRT